MGDLNIDATVVFRLSRKISKTSIYIYTILRLLYPIVNSAYLKSS